MKSEYIIYLFYSTYCDMQALETAHRVLNQDAQNIDSLRLVVLFLLARESRPLVAANRMSDLIEVFV